MCILHAFVYVRVSSLVCAGLCALRVFALVRLC